MMNPIVDMKHSNLRYFHVTSIWIAAYIVIVGCIMFCTTTSCMATTYDVTIGAGSNLFHQGKWKVDVTYDPATHDVSWTVVHGTGRPGQNTWDGWTWVIPGTRTGGNTVTFDAVSGRPTRNDGSLGPLVTYWHSMVPV